MSLRKEHVIKIEVHMFLNVVPPIHHTKC